MDIEDLRPKASADFTRFQDVVWDRFFDFIFDYEDELADKQVDEELRCRGLDVKRALSTVQQRLRRQRGLEQGGPLTRPEE